MNARLQEGGTVEVTGIRSWEGVEVCQESNIQNNKIMTFKMCVNWDKDDNVPWTCTLEPVINPDIVDGEKHYKTNCIEGGACFF